MSVDERINSALATFGLDVCNGVYRGIHNKYITYGYTSLAADFSDDRPHQERFLVHIELYSLVADNTNALVENIKRTLFGAGFTWPSAILSTDGTKRLTTFECETTEEIDSDGNI